MSKEKSERKASAGHLALHFERSDGFKDFDAMLSYQDGTAKRAYCIGTVAPAKASSEFGDIDCWGFTPATTVGTVKLAAFKRKTAREVKLGISEALFQTLVGSKEAKAVSGPSRVQGAGTAA